jgi:hypothetical protein
MNLTSPFLKAAAEAAGLSGHSGASVLKTAAEGSVFFGDDGADGLLSLLMSGLAGAAAALAVAIVLAVYFRSGYRSTRDMVRHGLAGALVLGLLAFLAYDLRHAALAYLSIKPAQPVMEFEIRPPKRSISPVAVTRNERDAVAVPYRVL